MLTLLSPAKTLDFARTHPPGLKLTEPEFAALAGELNAELRKLDETQLAKLMNLSAPLAKLNVERNLEWMQKPKKANCQAALAVFTGAVYVAMDSVSFSRDDFAYAQNHLAILSGLYGLLRPLDKLQAYRLEMGSQLSNSKGKNLYEFWGSKIAEKLDASGHDFILNLASIEYFKSVAKHLKTSVITIHFKQQKGDYFKVIGVHAKQARGLMARYILQGRVETIAGIKKFRENNYRFKKELSSPTELVFTR